MVEPQPSQEYLEAANLEKPEAKQGASQKKLLILDMNGTLLYRRPGNRRKGYARPFLEEFLAFAFENFYVMVWSSAMRKNVEFVIATTISRNLSSKFLGIWSRENMNLSKTDYYGQQRTFKNLELVWNNQKLESKGIFNQYNTIIVDDHKYRVCQQPFNHICLPEFNYIVDLNYKDTVLLDLIEHLKALLPVENVSLYLKNTQLTWKELKAKRNTTID